MSSSLRLDRLGHRLTAAKESLWQFKHLFYGISRINYITKNPRIWKSPHINLWYDIHNFGGIYWSISEFFNANDCNPIWDFLLFSPTSKVHNPIFMGFHKCTLEAASFYSMLFFWAVQVCFILNDSSATKCQYWLYLCAFNIETCFDIYSQVLPVSYYTFHWLIDYVKVGGCNQLVIVWRRIDCSPIKEAFPLLYLCAFKVETCFNSQVSTSYWLMYNI